MPNLPAFSFFQAFSVDTLRLPAKLSSNVPVVSLRFRID